MASAAGRDAAAGQPVGSPGAWFWEMALEPRIISVCLGVRDITRDYPIGRKGHS
ncbi:MAG: hypothetical protein LBT59_28750 [Clostridiales bacterium]|nr:hypothetical protein [Clostridiales bacterium]